MSDASEALREQLPDEIFHLVGPLFHNRPYAVDRLRAKVEGYLEELERSHRSGHFPEMDIELGRRCGASCLALLDALGERPPRDRHLLAHIATRYFVTTDDDEDDRESLVGFDDDALVINACARLMGVDGAVIPLLPR